MHLAILLLAFVFATPAVAAWPAGPSPDCAPDTLESCPPDFGGRWYLRSWTEDPSRLDDPTEIPLGSGIAADRAWRSTGGRSDVVIAVLDSGIEWDDGDLRRKIALNPEELPAPQGEDGVAEPGRYDTDGNGLFSIEDYRWDPRVSNDLGVDAADGALDASDLIAAFSDGIDDDGNGYVDDIAGWDLHWNDNDPSDDTRFGHGTYVATLAAAEGGDGGDIGVCYDCAILPVRVGDAFIADPDNIASAILYATDAGASVVLGALGALGNSPYLRDAIAYAQERGVVLVLAAGDESAWHPNPPGLNEGALYVHAVRYNADDEGGANTFLNYSNCTNYGPRLDLSVPSTGCASGATGVTAGAVGLVLSAARDEGLSPPLTPGEVRQLLTTTVVDVDLPTSRGPDADPDRYPSFPGWEQHFGYGRLDVGAAVAAVEAGRVPPTVVLSSPRWFEVFPADATLDITAQIAGRSEITRWTIEWAPGADPRDDAFLPLAEGEGAVAGSIAGLDAATRAGGGFVPTGTFSPRTATEGALERVAAAHTDAITLRLVVEDIDGGMADARKQVFFQPEQRPPFPLFFDGSIEASPRVADLEGDGALELIVATSAGHVHVVDAATAVARPGSPARTAVIEEWAITGTAHHRNSVAYQLLAPAEEPRSAIVATPAIADLDGDGTQEIVVATVRGEVFAFGADLAVRPGFPVAVDPALSPAESRHRRVERGFLGSPALADLDHDGALEIVAGAMDGYIYAWRADGRVLEGWPVPLVSLGPAESPFNRVVSSVAVGDVDGDGWDDVIAGSNEPISEQYAQLFAIHHDGLEHEGGAYLDGFPTYVFAGYTEILPIVGEGMPTSPSLADLDDDGDLEIGANAIADPGVIWDGTGEEWLNLRSTANAFGPRNNTDEVSLIQMMNNGTFADLDLDGREEWINGAVGFRFASAFLNDGNRHDFDHLLGVWDLGDGSFLDGFPQVVEDLQFFMNPAVADLSGDGYPEVVTASGGYLVHAWDKDGVEAPGFPRSVRGWAVASPVIEDLDGNGFLDVVVATRAGYLYSFPTQGPAHLPLPWPTFHHDNRSTGSVLTPLPARPPPVVAPPTPEDGCGCATSRSGGASFFLLLLFRRRRR